MTRLFRPTGFVDTPVGFDGQVARLAGGLQFFSAYEVREADRPQRLVPVAEIARELRDEAEAAVVRRLSAPRAPLTLGAQRLPLDQPRVVGILNVTPDSFSDGGRSLDGAAATQAGLAMAAAGAALVDIGGESTRPGAQPVWEGDEIARVSPAVQALANAGVAVSIDTRKASVMEAALVAGAVVVNDVSALLFDRRAVQLVADRPELPVVIMHSPDPAGALHGQGGYRDVLAEVFGWLEGRVSALERAGIGRERVVVDPGIGFGKNVGDNLALLNGLAALHGIGCALLVGASRKRFIGAVTDEQAAERRLGGSVAAALKAAEQGAQLLRVHDVAETVQAVKLWRGFRDAGLTG